MKICLHGQQLVGWESDYYATSGAPYYKGVGIFPLFPGVRTIGRVHLDEAITNGMIARGAAGADEWFSHCLPVYQANPGVWAWEAPNEPSIWNQDVLNGFVAFTQRLIKLMHDRGLRVIVGCLNTGWPTKAQVTQYIAAGIQGADGLALHEYSWPTLYDRVSQPGSPDLIFRYRNVRQWILDAGYQCPPIFITEMGLDQAVIDLPHLGWQGAGCSPREYADMVLWYNSEVEKDDYVECVTVFTTGHCPPWGTFEFNQEVAMMVAIDAPVPEPPPEPPEEPSPWINDIRGELPRHPTKKWATRAQESIDRIVVHHSAVDPPAGTTIREHLKAIARYHVDHNDWPGISYHYAIGAKGVVWVLNTPTDITYHAGDAGMNARSVGVCLLGDLTAHDPTPEQLDSLRWLRRGWSLPAIGHKEVVQTACPGPWWADWKAWVNDETAPPEPPPPDLERLREILAQIQQLAAEALAIAEGLG